MSDYIGLPGFIMRSACNAAYPAQGSKQPVYLQGSRQMTSTSRAYYEKNLGAGYFMSMDPEHGFTGYTEPLRRFIQPESYAPQVNEIQNRMPDWLPGEDYLINFQKGDPYIKVDEGYARLMIPRNTDNTRSLRSFRLIATIAFRSRRCGGNPSKPRLFNDLSHASAPPCSAPV